MERALFALPLEEPPVDVHAQILAATIGRPRLTFRAWEIWLVGTLFACMQFSVHPSRGTTADR